MPWATVANAVTDLRTLLSDGPQDKLAYRKRVIGDYNGTNTHFKTFEYRRFTSFTDVTLPLSLGVFVNGVRQSPGVGVTFDDPSVGEFVLATAPGNNDRVEASYYYQWFLDSELQTFLKEAAQWMNSTEDVTLLAIGLQPATKYFAAQEAMHKLAVRWAQRLSEVYKTEDAPKTDKAAVDAYRQLAKDYRDKAEMLRKQFYGRQDQFESPMWANNYGVVRDVVPKR